MSFHCMLPRFCLNNIHGSTPENDPALGNNNLSSYATWFLVSGVSKLQVLVLKINFFAKSNINIQEEPTYASDENKS